MSLINQMLQDLDARRAAHGVGSTLPNDVRPLPKAPATRWPLLLGASLLVLLGALLVYRAEVAALVATRFSRTDLGVPNAPVTLQPPDNANVLPVAPSLPAVSPAANNVLPAAATAPAQVAEANHAESIEPAEPMAEMKRLDGLDVSLRMTDFLPMSGELLAQTEAASDVKAEVVSGNSSASARREKKTAEAPASREPRSTLPSLGMPKAVSAAVPPAKEKPALETALRDSGRRDEKPAATPHIERTSASGSPREKTDGEYRKAIEALNQGRSSEAQDRLRNVLGQDSLHAASRQLLVKLLLESGNSQEAIRVLQDGLIGQPAQLGWAMSLARLQVDRGDLPGAWKTLQFSLPAASGNADYLGFAANVLQRLGQNEKAADHYQKATRIAPAEGRWWLGLGWSLDAQGRSAEAWEAFLRARQCGNLAPELLALIEQKLR